MKRTPLTSELTNITRVWTVSTNAKTDESLGIGAKPIVFSSNMVSEMWVVPRRKMSCPDIVVDSHPRLLETNVSRNP